jgi:hypothetical protein
MNPVKEKRKKNILKMQTSKRYANLSQKKKKKKNKLKKKNLN